MPASSTAFARCADSNAARAPASFIAGFAEAAAPLAPSPAARRRACARSFASSSAAEGASTPIEAHERSDSGERPRRAAR